MAIYSFEADLVDVPELEMELTDSRCTVLEGELVDTGTQVLTAELTTKTELVNYDDTELRQMIGEKADVSALNDYYSKAVVDAKLAQAGKVKSVNGRTGEVTLTCEDVGAASAQAMAAVSQRVEGKYGPDVPPPYPVTSVNGQTGNVVVLGVGEQYVTPQQFGAVGDGAADDTTAVQAAINSGKPVFFPAGRYRVTHPLTCIKTALAMFGQYGGGGVSNTLTDSLDSPASRVLPIIYEDFSDNGTLLDLSNKTSSFYFVCRGLVFISYKYSMSINTDTRDETRSDVITNGMVVPNCRAWISDCYFMGFSGCALTVAKQGITLRGISLYRCYLGASIDFNNNTLTDIWVNRCHTGIRFEANGSASGTQKMQNCWIDNIYSNAVESGKAIRILFNDMWVDTVGGCVYKELSGDGELRGIFTGWINRTNIFEGSGALECKSVRAMFAQIESTDSGGTYVNKPLFAVTGNFSSSTVIAPGRSRDSIVNVAKATFNLVNANGSLTTMSYPANSSSRSPTLVGGLFIASSLPTNSVFVGQMALVRANGATTGKLYVCTGTDPVIWVQVTV